MYRNMRNIEKHWITGQLYDKLPFISDFVPRKLGMILTSFSDFQKNSKPKPSSNFTVTKDNTDNSSYSTG